MSFGSLAYSLKEMHQWSLVLIPCHVRLLGPKTYLLYQI